MLVGGELKHSGTDGTRETHGRNLKYTKNLSLKRGKEETIWDI